MSTNIIIRADEKEKVAIQTAAQTAGKTLTDYILDELAKVGNWERVDRPRGKQFKNVQEILAWAYDDNDCQWAYPKPEFSEAALEYCAVQGYILLEPHRFKITDDGMIWLVNSR